MSELKVASGNTKGAQLGAGVSIKEQDKIASLVKDPLSNGAHIKTGGKTP